MISPLQLTLMASNTDKTNKSKPGNEGRDLVTERFIDALILTRAYFNDAGELMAQRLVGDALLLRRFVYPEGVQTSGEHSAADSPTKSLKRRATQADVER